MDRAVKGKVRLFVSSEVYDDLVSALRSQGVPLKEIMKFLSDCKTIPHESLPVSVEEAEWALHTYLKHGGPRKLHYFDSYHVATARYNGLTLLTSDRYIIDHATELGVSVLDVRAVGKSWADR